MVIQALTGQFHARLAVTACYDHVLVTAVGEQFLLICRILQGCFEFVCHLKLQSQPCKSCGFKTGC